MADADSFKDDQFERNRGLDPPTGIGGFPPAAADFSCKPLIPNLYKIRKPPLPAVLLFWRQNQDAEKPIKPRMDTDAHGFVFDLCSSVFICGSFSRNPARRL